MDLYIVRHAKAESFDEISYGQERALTELGRQQAANLAKLIPGGCNAPEVVLTSPVLRAKQTAELMCDALDREGSLVEPWLSCGMPPRVALSGLAGYQDFASVVIVGHEPDLSYLIMHLLSVDTLPFKVKKASLTVLSGVIVTGKKAELVEHRVL